MKEDAAEGEQAAIEFVYRTGTGSEDDSLKTWGGLRGALPTKTAKLVVGQERGQSTADLAFVKERGFVHQLLVLGDEVVKGSAHLLSAIVSARRILWRRGWGHTRRHASILGTLKTLEMRQRVSSGRRGGRRGEIFDGSRDDDQSADGQRRLESVPFRSCASSLLGRLQRRKRRFAQVAVGSKLLEATNPTQAGDMALGGRST